MAEALLSPLFTVILENLNSHVLKEFGIASGLNGIVLLTFNFVFGPLFTVVDNSGELIRNSNYI